MGEVHRNPRADHRLHLSGTPVRLAGMAHPATGLDGQAEEVELAAHCEYTKNFSIRTVSGRKSLARTPSLANWQCCGIMFAYTTPTTRINRCRIHCRIRWARTTCCSPS